MADIASLASGSFRPQSAIERNSRRTPIPAFSEWKQAAIDA
jgi:hypothetical protein